MYKYLYEGEIEIIIDKHTHQTEVIEFGFVDPFCMTKQKAKQKALDYLEYDGEIYGVANFSYDYKLISICPYNDCGFCYYDGHQETTSEHGECNNPQNCQVNDGH